MAELNTCQLNTIVTGLQTLDTSLSATDSDRTLRWDGINTELTLNASSTPAVTKFVRMDQALTAGSATIDLTSLTGANDESVTFSGLKVQVAKFKNKSGNAEMTIKFGVANPYNLLGASWTLKLADGAEITIYIPEGAPDVAGGAKDIDISGTDSEELEVQLFAG